MDEEARTRDRRKGYRGLQLRIIAPARALECIGPAMVEDIFTLAVRFQITGDGAEEPALGGFQPQMLAKPSCFDRGAAAVFKCLQKSQGSEGIVAGFASAACGAGQFGPFPARERVKALGDLYCKVACHTAFLRLRIIASRYCCGAALQDANWPWIRVRSPR